MTHQIIHKRRGEREVKAIAEAMISKLNEPQNLVKGDWKDCEFDYLLKRAAEELIELEEAVEKWQRFKRRGLDVFTINEAAKEVLKEAADVANFPMMIADKVGALE